MKTLEFPFKVIGKGLVYLFKERTLTKITGAKFSEKRDYERYLNPGNKGLLLDGLDARLSEQESFQNVCLMARVGAGKTSRYIIPNVLDKARQNCSIVVNDPKGEVFENTSAYMQQCGFKVLVIDPQNIERSSHFNPLAEAREFIELEQIAEIIVRSGLPSNSGKDDIWLQGAIRFVSLFLKCLKNAGDENPEFFTLSNLNYLFQNYGRNGSPLDTFMSNYSVDPVNPADESIWNEWLGLQSGNEEGIQSFVLNAITSLKSLSNPNIAKVTSKSDIDLEALRHQKTIIYFITPAQYGDYYSFLTSLFFRSVFNACMRTLPNKKTLPVYILYDEFGNSTIPNFHSTANTIRGYKVSLSIVLQTISQLDTRYGRDYAKSIQGGFNTYMTLSGADHQTAEFFEAIIGKVRERQRKELDDPSSEYREYNLINAAEVRTIEADEALIVSANRQPVKLKSTPYFQYGKFKRQSKRGACQMIKPGPSTSLTYVPLK